MHLDLQWESSYFERKVLRIYEGKFYFELIDMLHTQN